MLNYMGWLNKETRSSQLLWSSNLRHLNLQIAAFMEDSCGDALLLPNRKSRRGSTAPSSTGQNAGLNSNDTFTTAKLASPASGA